MFERVLVLAVTACALACACGSRATEQSKSNLYDCTADEECASGYCEQLSASLCHTKCDPKDPKACVGREVCFDRGGGLEPPVCWPGCTEAQDTSCSSYHPVMTRCVCQQSGVCLCSQ